MPREHVSPSGATRPLLALVAGAAVTVFLVTCAYRHFAPIRRPLVKGRIAASTDAVDVRERAVDPGQALVAPFVIIASIGHERGTHAQFHVLLDDRPVCQVASSSGTTTRVSCVVESAAAPDGGHHVLVRGPRGTWSLDYLELSTHFGSSRSFVDFYVVPHGSTAYDKVSVVVAVLLGALVAGLLLLPATEWRRRTRLGQRTLAIVIIAALTLSAAVPLSSRYLVVLSLKTVSLLLIVVLAPQIAWAANWIGRLLEEMWPVFRRPVIRCVLAATIVSGAYGTVVAGRVADAQGNYSALLRISRSIFDRSPLVSHRQDLRQTLILQDGGGYDGQFMYYAALDPFLRAFRDRPEAYVRVIDAPAYRYGRIGFSLLADALTLGNAASLPAVMVWIPVVAAGLAAFALARIAQFLSVSWSWALLMLLVPGFWQSVQFTLPEPLAAALILTGYAALLRRHVGIAGLAFAGSLLVRETGVVFVLLAAGLAWRSMGRTAAIRLVLIALVPVLAWRTYVGWVLFPVFGAEAFYQNPRNVTVPFRGFVDLWTQMSHGTYADGDAGFNRAARWYPIVLIAGLLASLRLAWRQRTALTLATLVYALLAVSLDFPSIWQFTGNGQRGTYELFVMLALVTVTTFRSMSLTDRAIVQTVWLLAGGFILFGSFDAAFVRDALF